MSPELAPAFMGRFIGQSKSDLVRFTSFISSNNNFTVNSSKSGFVGNFTTFIWNEQLKCQVFIGFNSYLPQKTDSLFNWGM